MLRCMPIGPSLFTVAMSVIFAVASSVAQTRVEATEPGVRHAVILVGLPGDDEHAEQFATIVDAWHAWLTDGLGFAPHNILTLQDQEGDAAATKENISRKLEQRFTEIKLADTLWVFVLGHADDSSRRVPLHLPGPDLNDMEFAELFAGVECHEQLFWFDGILFQSFPAPLSRKGRIVVTATASDEGQNETEFPAALADVTRKHANELDQDQSRIVSLAEVFLAVVAEVKARYAADGRLATEHAQLDDNGDGQGTEAEKLSFTEPPPDSPKSLRNDGAVAAQVRLPWNTRQEPVEIQNKENR